MQLQTFAYWITYALMSLAVTTTSSCMKLLLLLLPLLSSYNTFEGVPYVSSEYKSAAAQNAIILFFLTYRQPSSPRSPL